MLSKEKQGKQERISIHKIKKDESYHARSETNDEIVMNLTQLIASGQEPPPIDVYHDGDLYWIADGFYRYEAYMLVGRGTIPAIVFKGGREKALIHALGANRDHGLRRSNKDKRKAVEIALLDVSLKGNSDNQIAEICMVSQPFVSKIRKLLTYNGYKFDTIRKCSNGRIMDVSNIGTKPETETEPVTTHPEVPEIENNKDEVIGPSDHEELEMDEIQNHAQEESIETDPEGDTSEEEAQDDVGTPPETESGGDEQDLGLEGSENSEAGLDTDETTDPETTKDESDLNLDDAVLEVDSPSADIDDSEKTTGDDYPDTSDLGEIAPNALKRMLVSLQDTVKQQQEELKVKDHEIVGLEQQVEKLEEENIYLKEQLQGYVAAKIDVSASLDVNKMEEEEIYSMA